ncbi:serine hydrolase domain-containing protein [Faecalispora anaeroviscerum]|uniref:serine hydrolase domain-containing protein n=1 Tax=Faecalispora anaeroviscerum TaxID=2991836 RepID=UPI0024B9DE6D|nr:serine hydrolase [Faecalispora anaeroviscerum]
MNQEKSTELEQTICRDYSNIAGIIVQKNGETVYEGYFNGYTAERALHVFSVTKSIVNALIGIAIDQGYLNSVDQKVLDFFSNYTVKRGEKTAQCVTIRDILTMTAPYKYKSAPYTKYFTSESWVKAALDLLGGKGEIGQFRYTPLIGPDILTGILTKATGRSVLDFARENLFAPLGIHVDRNVVFQSKEEQLAIMTKENDISGWAADPQGINTAGWGLFLTPTEMAKIGQLYLNRGAWNSKQLVSAEWIDESTKEHSRWDELGLKYGYLWWVIDEEEHSYAAMGDGGNVIYVNPAKNLVIAIASRFVPRPRDRIDFIKEVLEPMFENQE